MKREAEKDLVEHALIEQRLNRGLRMVVVSPILYIGIHVLLGEFNVFPSGVVVGLVLVFFISLSIFIFALERRTRKGYEALNHLKGFKLFLEVTEKERYKFHNAPKLSPQQFMEYLPYAIAFGVEREWAKVFKDIQIGAPDWYSSPAGSSFNAVVFTTNLSAFSTSFSSTSRSSGSGSSGGGFSGGGSGGGGGGSW